MNREKLTKMYGIDPKLSGEHHAQSIEIHQFLDGVYVRSWNGVREAARYFGINPSNISKCLKGVQKSAGGFKWKY